MAVPSSGPIRMLYVAKELFNSDYTAPIPDSTVIAQFPNGISLGDMSTGAGSFSNDPINTSNPAADRPDGVVPHAMSEFYRYDHDYLAPFIYLAFSRTAGSTLASNTLWTDYTNTNNPDPIVNPTGSGSISRWRQGNFSVRQYQGRRIKLLIGFNHGTASFRCDLAINSWYMTNVSNQFYEGETEGPWLNYAKTKFRNNVLLEDQNSDNENVVMQRHLDHNQGSALFLNTSNWTNFPASITTSPPPTRGDENRSTDNGEWNWHNGLDGDYPETNSNGTGPLNNYLARDANSDGFMDSEQEGTSIYWGYTYYEASGQTAQRYAWFRTVAIDVPDDADKVYFNYSAWSDDQTTWYNSWLQIHVQLD